MGHKATNTNFPNPLSRQSESPETRTHGALFLSLGASTHSPAAVVTVSKELSPETQHQSKSWEAMCRLGWNLQLCPVLYFLTFKGPDGAFCIDLVKIQ